MVNFDAPEMYAKSSSDLVQFGTIETRYNVLAAIEHARAKWNGGQRDPAGLSQLKGLLERLLLELWDEYKRYLSAKKFKESENPKEDAERFLESFEERIKTSNDIDTLILAFRTLERFTDSLGITRMDRESLGGNIVKRNRAQGLQ